MQIQIFRKRTRPRNYRRFLSKIVETSIKCSLLLSYPAGPAICVCLFWYFVLFEHHIHFHEGLTEIAVAAWIPIFGILYGLLAAVVLNTVWTEYKNLRMAIKCYDIATFMNLRDEDMSPLVHVMTTLVVRAGQLYGVTVPQRGKRTDLCRQHSILVRSHLLRCHAN
jgi:hypothetical protein